MTGERMRSSTAPLAQAKAGLAGQASGAERVSFSVPGLAPASWSGNSRAHWRRKYADGKQYAELVFCSMVVARALRNGSVWPRARLTITQRAVHLRDEDNFASSFKPGLDAIVRAGIITDDSTAHIETEYEHVRVGSKADEAVVILVEKL